MSRAIYCVWSLRYCNAISVIMISSVTQGNMGTTSRYLKFVTQTIPLARIALKICEAYNGNK